MQDLSNCIGKSKLADSIIYEPDVPYIIIRIGMPPRFSVSISTCLHEPHGGIGLSVKLPDMSLAAIHNIFTALSGYWELA